MKKGQGAALDPPGPRAPDPILHGLIAGTIASFVKWGVEVPLPPRRAGQTPPPDILLARAGIDPSRLTYRFSGHRMNWGGAAIHHAFSLAGGVAYAAALGRFPRLARDNGTAYGLLVTALFHGAILPAARLAPPVRELPRDEIVSETIGHLAWSWTIALVLRALR